MSVFKHVLVAYDFSEASGRALELAAAMVRESGVDLHVVHVCEIPPLVDVPNWIDLVTPIKEQAQARLGELIRSIRDVAPGAKGVLKVGNAWEEILVAASEVGADLIIAGTHGRRGVAHAFIGSVAERVVRHSEIPVLTARSRVR